MFSKYLYFGILTVISLLLQGAACFFVKHVNTGMCINVTGIVEETQTWGSLIFVGLTNKCLDPTVQYRFDDNSAMRNLESMTCLEGTRRGGNGYNLPMLYLLRATNPINNCRNRDDAATQTSWGGLSINYLPGGTQCAVPKTDSRIKNQGVDPYVGLEDCTDAEDKRFNFGSVTCSGNMIENANCPPNQYMVVKTASYRRLSPTEICGSSNDSDCEVDVTCRLKKQCDGKSPCSITVNDNLFSGDQCPGSKRYLYFEYHCSDTKTSFNDLCVDSVSLSSSSLPNEGFVQITTDEGLKNVCWQSLGSNAKDVVCRELGYKRAVSLVGKAAPSDLTDAKFSGNIMCGDGATELSQCSFSTSSSQSCSSLSYLKCHICNRPLLEDKQRFPDASFTASASSGSPSDARISSGSSWCAPVADGKHYLQLDFGRLYVIYNFVTFGDTTSPKWVTTYNLNYTDDGKNWKSVQILGNKDAYNNAAIELFYEGIKTTALRFIPLSFQGQPCMRIEICGDTQFPDKPTHLTVTNIKSRSAEISWKDPDITGDRGLTGFWIKLKKENSLILDITISKVNTYTLNNLTAYTKYEISVAAGNKHGFGEKIMTSLTTSEEAPEGSPLNVIVTAESSSSLSVTWEPPDKDKRNGMIVNYTVCVSHEENKPCFKNQTTKEKMLVIGSLNVSTKYYVRVLASTEVGRGPFSESKGEFTNGKQPEVSTNRTASTLTFVLQIPPLNFPYFYVVALELKDGKQKQSPASYKNNKLVTYSEAKQSTDPKPYIAAILTSKDKNMFILGDGRNTNIPTSRRRRSTSCGYYNGPLKPDTSYIIFQRIFIDNKNYYSTNWTPSSKTSKDPELGGNCAEDDEKFKYLVGIIVVVILLVISLAINVYLTYQNRYLSNQNRRLKSSKENRESKRKDRNNSKDIYENPDKIQDDVNYEDVESEQSTYTALKRTGKDENDDHLYAHLNEELHKDYENKKETGM